MNLFLVCDFLAAAGIKHELVMFLGNKSKLKRVHLELLLDESTTKIDFSTRASSALLRDSLLDLICIRCKVDPFTCPTSARFCRSLKIMTFR